MKSWILSVGDEVLSGKTINTNFSTISSYFNQIGIDVVKGITIGDNKDDIIASTNSFMDSDVDLMITTGGLGPTHDDFTKEVISEALGIELVYNEQASNDMYNYFKERKHDCNLKQVYYPKDCIIISNPIGSADGFIIEKNNKIIIGLVGVPFEMDAMMKQTVIPYLKSKGKQKLYKQFLVMGDTESSIENRLIPFIDKHPYVSICPYCSPAKIRYQLTANTEYEEYFLKTVEDFKQFMGDLIVSEEDQEIEEIVVKKLLEKKYTISCAESVTGGMLASTIINVSGASNVIKESYVTYSNEIKNKLLNVSFDTIEKYDVVSEEVVKEMALGLYSKTKSNICIATSGYADSGKCSGKVCFAILINGMLKSYSLVFRGNRNLVRLRAVRRVLYELFLLLKKEKGEDNGK